MFPDLEKLRCKPSDVEYVEEAVTDNMLPRGDPSIRKQVPKSQK